MRLSFYTLITDTHLSVLCLSNNSYNSQRAKESVRPTKEEENKILVIGMTFLSVVIAEIWEKNPSLTGQLIRQVGNLQVR